MPHPTARAVSLPSVFQLWPYCRSGAPPVLVVAQGTLFRSLHRSGRMRESVLPASHMPLILMRLAVAAWLEPEALAGLSKPLYPGPVPSRGQRVRPPDRGRLTRSRMPGRYSRPLDATHGAMAQLAKLQEGEEG